MKVVFLTGRPGSGKGSQGKILSEILGVPHISTGELFRNEAKTNSEIGNKMKEFMDKGEIIPNDIHFAYLNSKLNEFTNGYILDGYPKNEECFDFIMNTLENKCKPVVVFLDVSRQTAYSRLTSRLYCNNCDISRPKTDVSCPKCFGNLEIRHDDNEITINHRLDVYEKYTVPLFERYRKMGILKIVDGEQNQEHVMINTLAQMFPCNNDIESIFHNHIDAKNKNLVEKINQEISEHIGSNCKKYKLYSVESLNICSQISQMPGIYNQLPNFHQIQNSSEEAFSTCKMGNELDYVQELATLDIAFKYTNQGVMTEIEEELLMYDMNKTHVPQFTLIRQCNYEINWSKLEKYTKNNIVKSKLFELHHGFEIKKINDILPISLEYLSQVTSSFGFKNGGWFIFKDSKNDSKNSEKRWLYRSNEFSEESYTSCILTLLKQSRQLQSFLQTIIE